MGVSLSVESFGGRPCPSRELLLFWERSSNGTTVSSCPCDSGGSAITSVILPVFTSFPNLGSLPPGFSTILFYNGTSSSNSPSSPFTIPEPVQLTSTVLNILSSVDSILTSSARSSSSSVLDSSQGVGPVHSTPPRTMQPSYTREPSSTTGLSSATTVTSHAISKDAPSQTGANYSSLAVFASFPAESSSSIGFGTSATSLFRPSASSPIKSSYYASSSQLLPDTSSLIDDSRTSSIDVSSSSGDHSETLFTALIPRQSIVSGSWSLSCFSPTIPSLTGPLSAALTPSMHRSEHYTPGKISSLALSAKSSTHSIAMSSSLTASADQSILASDVSSTLPLEHTTSSVGRLIRSASPEPSLVLNGISIGISVSSIHALVSTAQESSSYSGGSIPTTLFRTTSVWSSVSKLESLSSVSQGSESTTSSADPSQSSARSLTSLGWHLNSLSAFDASTSILPGGSSSDQTRPSFRDESPPESTSFETVSSAESRYSTKGLSLGNLEAPSWITRDTILPTSLKLGSSETGFMISVSTIATSGSFTETAPLLSVDSPSASKIHPMAFTTSQVPTGPEISMPTSSRQDSTMGFFDSMSTNWSSMSLSTSSEFLSETGAFFSLSGRTISDHSSSLSSTLLSSTQHSFVSDVSTSSTYLTSAPIDPIEPSFSTTLSSNGTLRSMVPSVLTSSRLLSDTSSLTLSPESFASSSSSTAPSNDLSFSTSEQASVPLADESDLTSSIVYKASLTSSETHMGSSSGVSTVFLSETWSSSQADGLSLASSNAISSQYLSSLAIPEGRVFHLPSLKENS